MKFKDIPSSLGKFCYTVSTNNTNSINKDFIEEVKESKTILKITDVGKNDFLSNNNILVEDVQDGISFWVSYKDIVLLENI